MILKAEGLIKVYYDRMIVKGVSISISKGEIVGLLGANGAGKTTTFYMIAGLIPPTEGEVYLENEKITGLPLYARAKKGIGYLPQEPSIFRQLSVEDNIMAVLEFTKLSKKERILKKEQLIDEFGLSHVKKNKGNILSGGERRRTEIARALATNPAFLLLDEPFAGVDPIAVEEIQDILKNLKNKNLGILITDHNVDETLAITDRSYLMFEGNVLKKGTADELAKDEKVKKVYLGKKFILKEKIRKQQKEKKINTFPKSKSLIKESLKKSNTPRTKQNENYKNIKSSQTEKGTSFLNTIFSLFTSTKPITTKEKKQNSQEKLPKKNTTIQKDKKESLSKTLKKTSPKNNENIEKAKSEKKKDENSK